MAPEACGCSCACHNSLKLGEWMGCQNEAKWLEEYKVWACDDCLVFCDS